MPPSAQKTRRCMVCVDVGVSTVGLDYLGRLPLAEQALRQMASTSHRAPIIASTHIDQDQSTITCSRPSYSPRGCSWGCRRGRQARRSEDHSGLRAGGPPEGSAWGDLDDLGDLGDLGDVGDLGDLGDSGDLGDLFDLK